MNKALDLLEIQRQALGASTRKALGFSIANHTLKLVPYKQAIFWVDEGLSLGFETVSGNGSVDGKGPYGIWLKDVIRKNVALDPVTLKASDILSAGEDKWCAEHVVALPLVNAHGESIGGLWLERDTPFKDTEIALLQELKPVWEVKLSLILLENRKRFVSWNALKKRQKYIWIACVVLALMPVRLNITAPAEIVAQEKMVASAPYEGIVQKVLINPGEQVEEGQVLAMMESEALEAEARAASRALETAQSALSRLKREALGAPEKKAEINVLEAEIQAKHIEYDFAQTMLERSEIKSPRAGIAIFADANQFEGKPVITGETLMEIAAPGDIELLVRVPVDALVPFDTDAPVDVYLNVAPLTGLEAKITSIGYQASPDPDGLLTYKMRAALKDAPEDIRIGWKGTAKVHGSWTILAYSILRRPLAAMRRMGGG